MDKIRIGIVGYGNLGRGVELSINQNEDMELIAIFTRRNPSEIKGAKDNMVHISKIESYVGKIDIMILCGGSATDLQNQGPDIAKLFNTVDSFDTHAKIPEYFDKMNDVATNAKNLSIISVGWDPGLFSIARLLGNVALPQGQDYTFWGKGVSQGHSDAIRRIEGVANAIQYTVPLQDALDKVRNESLPNLTTREKHERVCYVVAKENADLDKIENEIVNMPNYFKDYNTVVNFISEEELKTNHSGMPHGGTVIRKGITGNDTDQRIEFSLELGSNPEFTSSVLVCFARAVHRLANEGKVGAISVFDVPFTYLSIKEPAQLRKELL